MKCEVLNDGPSFLDAAGPFLAGNEAENTVLLGAVLRRRRKHFTAPEACCHNGTRVGRHFGSAQARLLRKPVLPSGQPWQISV